MKNWLLASAATAALSASVGLLAIAAEAPKSSTPGPAASPASRPATEELPRAQKVPPGPALSPEQAMAKMKLPPGFKVECVAAEPLIVNPTAFTWDDRGRIWVTESVEYPRKPAGKGQDRVKILEDTDGDGKMDKATIFADGLNIPCGVVHGNGGVYVTNSPDVLFLEDTNGDGVADKRTVVLTGFGRDDTHELPNSLTWGPDGWLYGMNGVFNKSSVKDPYSGKTLDFTAALWRYHPPTKRFELFAEGTSNPWGLDYDRRGEWFVSACVIDHLWHLTQSGYYHRQGGAYPPNVQAAQIQSISTEKHQQAAYAGLCIYDGDAFPAEYRGRFLMGNLHGSALNQDVVTRQGSTYVQKNFKGPADNPLNDGEGNLDFLQANDAWFMPVAQKVGPDGCLYVMDWYDRYHCYQDANRDGPGVDRLKGRIYRISHNDTPHAPAISLNVLESKQLIDLLAHPNVWWRRQAQRILNERHGDLNHSTIVDRLRGMALDTNLPNNANMHALWLLAGQNALGDELLDKALADADETIRGWAVRSVGGAGKASPAVYDKLKSMAATDPSPSVRVQVAIAAGRLTENDPLPILAAGLAAADGAADPLFPRIAYMNLRPLTATRGKDVLAALAAAPGADNFAETTAKWVKQAIATSGKGADDLVAEAAKALNAAKNAKSAGQALEALSDGLAGIPTRERAKAVTKPVRDVVEKYVASDDLAARLPAVAVALWWQDPKATRAARQIVADPGIGIEARVSLAKTLAEGKAAGNAPAFAALASDEKVPLRLRQVAIDALGAIGKEDSAAAVVKLYSSLPPDLKPGAVNALTRTVPAAAALLAAVEAKAIPAADLTANHARSILALNDKPLADRLGKAWGAVKTDRDPERVKVVERWRKVVQSGKGDPLAGVKVFEGRCAQCHTIYGKGGTVGPDLTGAGRDDLDAVLTNVLDPNLVIGAPYYVHVAKTKDGDVISGLLVEQSDKQVVLKDQTKTTAIPRANLEKLTVQNVSIMPEGLEAQMSEQEFRDLVAFLLTRQAPK